jgi:hypothetical protein
MTIAAASPAACAAGDAGALELDAVNRTAQAHAELAGIRPGEPFSDAQCRHLRALVERELDAAGVVPGRRMWFTGLELDGRLVGNWGESWLEAALTCAQRGRLAWLVADPHLEIRAQYVAGRHDPAERFPVTDRPLSRAELAMLDVPADALF